MGTDNFEVLSDGSHPTQLTIPAHFGLGRTDIWSSSNHLNGVKQVQKTLIALNRTCFWMEMKRDIFWPLQQGFRTHKVLLILICFKVVPKACLKQLCGHHSSLFIEKSIQWRNAIIILTLCLSDISTWPAQDLSLKVCYHRRWRATVRRYIGKACIARLLPKVWQHQKSYVWQHTLTSKKNSLATFEGASAQAHLLVLGYMFCRVRFWPLETHPSTCT